MEDVEKAKRWATENNLKPEPITESAEHPAETPQVSGKNPAEPKTDSVPAVNQPAPPHDTTPLPSTITPTTPQTSGNPPDTKPTLPHDTTQTSPKPSDTGNDAATIMPAPDNAATPPHDTPPPLQGTTVTFKLP